MSQDDAPGSEDATMRLAGRVVSRDGNSELVMATDANDRNWLHYWMTSAPGRTNSIQVHVWKSELRKGNWVPAIPPEMEVDEGL